MANLPNDIKTHFKDIIETNYKKFYKHACIQLGCQDTAKDIVQEALETLMKDRTSIIIAHRLSTIKNADNIIVLQNGRIVQQGNYTELLKDTTGFFYSLNKLQIETNIIYND